MYKSIGKGAYGEIFLAKEKDSNELSAMKVIARKLLKDKTDPTKFANRLAVLQEIKHRNCVQILDKTKTSNNYYVKMEYVNGPNLYEYLNYYKKKHNKPLSEEVVQRLIRQVSNGLEYLHQKKIIHRDIKLENLMIHYDAVKYNNLSDDDVLQMKTVYRDLEGELFTVKICDFGFSRIVDDEQKCSTLCGTPIIMAPDILNNADSSGYGLLADLWSLGVVTYELLVGVPPFNNCKLTALLEDIKKGAFAYPTNVDISIEAVSFVNNLLQYDPKRRMNFDKLWAHPFMKMRVGDFHKMSLKLDLNEKSALERLKKFNIDSKDEKGLIWLVYEDGNQVGLNLDEVDQNYLESKLNYKYIPEVKKKDKGFAGMVVDEEVDMRDITDLSFVNLSKKKERKLEDSDGFINLDDCYKMKDGGGWEIITDESEGCDD